VASTALFALANVALARASDPALPGQFLYPLDRTYEWLSDRFASNDHVPERVAEARELAEVGHTDRALQVVGEILGDNESLAAEVAQLSGRGSSPAVRDEVIDLVGAASSVHEAAQSGDAAALEVAIDNVKEAAKDVAETASKGNAGGNSDNRGATAPGQVDSPSDTAPGQVDSPSDTAPGQVDSPSDTAPGRNPDAGASNSQSGGRGQGSSNP
jgi:hypothetical protein